MSDDVLPSDDTVVWRYLKLNSFLELLRGHVVQVRLDSFEDDAEGAYGWKEIRFTPRALESIGIRSNGEAASVARAIRIARLHAVATCWFEFTEESYAMWRVFGRPGESVAIETTVGELRRLLEDAAGNMRIERVRYEPMSGELDDIRSLFFHKRPEFKYEHEIRSIQVFGDPVQQNVYHQQLDMGALNRLIRRVITAPGTRTMFFEAVCDAVESVFAMDKVKFAGTVDRSSLDADLLPNDDEEEEADRRT